ncbi:limulus clotting factor C-like [Uloborus diversus]|uniref:limulus clotting factor C-like n=1 Tax=Uloborus diversus TaxID=327109 RepID=UPI002409B7DC|nr:limulus clotting factor C-like [Uloborus diversus]
MVPSCETGTCGQSLVQTVGKITHGERTKAGEWPWMVAIAINYKNFSNVVCGGALIDTQTVLTAAHCFDTPDVFELFFGKYRRQTADDDEKVEKRTNLTVKIHPNYNKTTYDSDIAVVRFSPRIKYNDRVQPICLPSFETTAHNIHRGKKGYVTGWGLNEKDMPSDALFMAHLPVMPADFCVKAYQNQGLQLPITSNMFCAGFENGGTSACTGDSGSPMVFRDRRLHRYVVEGLVSFGVSGECGLPRRYTVFTKIQPYLPWIFHNKS